MLGYLTKYLKFVTEDGRIGFPNSHSHAWMTPKSSKSTRELNYFIYRFQGMFDANVVS